MWEFRRSKAAPIGIDLGSSSLKLVQLNAADGRLELAAAAACEVPQDIRNNPEFLHEWYIQNIKQLLLTSAFNGRRAVTSLPSRDVITHHLRVAKGSPDEIAADVASEAQEKLPFNAAPQLLRHVVAGEVYDSDDAKLEVIMMALDQRGMNRHLDILDRTNLETVSISVESSAILTAMAPLLLQEDMQTHATMFVDLGRTATRIVIAHGDHLAFARTLNVTLSAESPPNFVRRLCEEIRNCARYHDLMFQERGVTQLLFIGGGAADTDLCAQVSGGADIPGQPGDPTGHLAEDTRFGSHSDMVSGQSNADWTVAIGLALQGIESHQGQANAPAAQLVGDNESVPG